MPGHFKSILIVEDDRDIREALRDILRSEGYNTLEAENGKVALKIIQDKELSEPCLILLDLMMPEMNGWEFLEARRKDDAITAIPTIIISAVRGAMLPKGAIKIMKKPINLIELINEIEGYCKRGNAA